MHSDPTPDSPAPPRAPRAGVLLAAVLAATAAAYSEAPRGPFVWDDWSLIPESTAVREGGPLADLALGPFWTRSAAAPAAFSYYRPLVSLSYALDWRISGGAPGWFHVVNVLLHLGSVTLVFLLAQRAGAGTAAAALGAALFGLAPRLTESVAWISGRTDLWASLFALLALLLHRPGPAGRGRRAAAAAALFLGLCGKEVAAAAFAGIAVMEAEAARSAERRAAGVIGGLWPAALAGAVYFLLRTLALGKVAPSSGLPLGERFLAAAQALGTYVTMVLDPLRPEQLVGNLVRREPAMVAVGLASGITLAAAVAWAVRRGMAPVRAALLATSLGALALVLHFIPIAVTVVAADRFLYLPLAGLAAAAAGVTASLGSRARRVAAAAAVLAVPFFWTHARARIAEWREPEALWRTALQRSGGDGLAELELGNVLFREGRSGEALDHYRAATRGTVGDLHRAALGNVASAASELGRYDEARRATLGLVALEPARALHRYNLAIIEVRRLDFSAAEARLEEALRLQPAYPEAIATRQKLEGLRRELARLGPDTDGEGTEVRAARASLWARLGRDREAQQLYVAVARAPDASRRLLVEAAQFLAAIGEPGEAKAALVRAEASGADEAELAPARRSLDERQRRTDPSPSPRTPIPEIPGR